MSSTSIAKLSLLPLLSLMVSCATAKSDVAAKPELNPYGKAFSGEGVEVQMAIFNEKNADGLNDVLLKITGGPAYEAGIDGQVLRYQAVPGGTGVDFKYMKDGEQRNRMISRESWGSWTFFELYLAGKTYNVGFNQAKSKDVQPEQLLSQFNASKS